MHAAIQILFVEEREHWVVSSFTNGKLRLYDRCSTGGLTSSLQVQLAQIYGNQFAMNSTKDVTYIIRYTLHLSYCYTLHLSYCSLQIDCRIFVI